MSNGTDFDRNGAAPSATTNKLKRGAAMAFVFALLGFGVTGCYQEGYYAPAAGAAYYSSAPYYGGGYGYGGYYGPGYLPPPAIAIGVSSYGGRHYYSDHH